MQQLLIFLLFVASLAAASPDLRLVEAAKNQDKEAVRSLLKEHADVNAPQADGATALAWAVHWGDIEMADLLIRAGANANAANEYGVTPLSMACTHRNAAMVEKLLKAGANPNAPLWTGETPLMTCAGTGSVGAVKSLLDHGADVNAKEKRRGQTALMWAIADQHPEVARVLIEHGGDVRVRSHKLGGFQPMVMAGYGRDVPVSSKGGWTPLLFAARVGDRETAHLLLAKGADIHEATEEAGTALVIATAGGFEDLALFLLDNGADPNAKDSSGITPLHYALRDGLKVLHGMDVSNVKRVCGAGAGARCVAAADAVADPNFITAAVSATANAPQRGRGEEDTILPGSNMSGLVKALLAHGADPNARLAVPPPRLRLRRKPLFSLAGATPFLLASAAGDLPAMRTLVEGRAQPLVGTVADEKELFKQGFGDDNQIQGDATPLMVAAGMGRKDDFSKEEEQRALEAVQVLVELGADVNAATATGWTALHAAAYLGGNSIIQFLVEKGARVNVQNGCGQTPLSLAGGTDARGLLERVAPHRSTAELLRKLGAGSSPPGGPVGRCVEGRFGLDYAAVKSEDKKESAKEKE